VGKGAPHMDEGIKMTITERFKHLLKMSEQSFILMIDMYNKNQLSRESMIAMEAIEALNEEDR